MPDYLCGLTGIAKRIRVNAHQRCESVCTGTRTARARCHDRAGCEAPISPRSRRAARTAFPGMSVAAPAASAAPAAASLASAADRGGGGVGGGAAAQAENSSPGADDDRDRDSPIFFLFGVQTAATTRPAP